MWNKSDNISIIDEGMTVDGTISAEGKLVIKGAVKGSLVGKTVIVAKEGVICADTKVASITIGGKFDGELEASNEVIILSTGSCGGRVVCKNLVVEAGGILNAEINCISKQEPTK